MGEVATKPEATSPWRQLERVIEDMRTTIHDDWHVDERTCDNARLWLDMMEVAKFPSPRIFCHGGDAIVFTWEDQRPYCLLTITGKNASPLLSPKRHSST